METWIKLTLFSFKTYLNSVSSFKYKSLKSVFRLFVSMILTFFCYTIQNNNNYKDLQPNLV